MENRWMPPIGVGTWQITDKTTLQYVLQNAYETGYRMIDTAAAYGNEIAIGKVLREWNVTRADWFLQDKLWNTCREYHAVMEACKKSLHKLKVEYLDAYLIHWPASPALFEDWEDKNAQTWRAMEELYQAGYVKMIGVCNFKVAHLQALMKNARIMPMIDQIEFHPGMNQTELVEFCRNNSILIEGSSPLGNGQILRNPDIGKIAQRKQKTPAQICLRYAVDMGIVPIPKTVSKERLIENYNIFDFDLSEEEKKEIAGIPFCGGLAIDPDTVTEFG